MSKKVQEFAILIFARLFKDSLKVHYIVLKNVSEIGITHEYFRNFQS